MTPNKPGYYWAKSESYQWFNLIARLSGEPPFMQIHVWHLFDDKVYKVNPDRITEWGEPIDGADVVKNGHTFADLQRMWEEAHRELAAARNDLVMAAGELMVPVPEPGSDMARSMAANVLMRAERDKWRDMADALVSRLSDVIQVTDRDHQYWWDGKAIIELYKKMKGKV